MPDRKAGMVGLGVLFTFCSIRYVSYQWINSVSTGYVAIPAI